MKDEGEEHFQVSLISKLTFVPDLRKSIKLHFHLRKTSNAVVRKLFVHLLPPITIKYSSRSD